MVRHLLTESHMSRSSLKNVEKESLRRPAHVFTDSDSLAKTVKKDVGQSHDKRFRIVVSTLREGFREVENTSLQWLPTHLQVADLLTKMMEKDILVSFFNSRAFQTCGQEDLCEQNSHRKCLMLPRNEFFLVCCEHL